MSTSDESATRVWRPLGTRIAAIAFGIAFFVVCTVFWVALDPEIKATFTVPQRATLIVLGLMMAAALHAMARSRIESRPEGLVVVNGYKRREFAWAEVLGITLPRGAPWATLDLADGHAVAAMGIQNSDGPRAQTAVREVRALIDR